MLPKDVILSPEQHSVDAIYWHYDMQSDIPYWTATDGYSFFAVLMAILIRKFRDI
jgi:hypothetical protein